MRVLHIGEVAGVPWTLARAQRDLGHSATVLAYRRHPFAYSYDECFPETSGIPEMYLERLRFFYRFLGEYDVYHFHGGTLLPKGMDSLMWRSLGIDFFVHHHGAHLKGGIAPSVYSRFASRTFVSTPNLLDWCPEAEWIPNPILLDEYPYIGVDNQVDSREMRVVHAPSSRTQKGTNYLVQAVKALQRDGIRIKLTLVENVSHNVALECYRTADIVVDQLLIGWYGVFAVECMALGKPVCVFIRDDLQSYLPSCPLVNTTVESVGEVLRELAEDCSLRSELGRKGREFVERFHEGHNVARRLQALYESPGRKRL